MAPWAIDSIVILITRTPDTVQQAMQIKLGWQTTSTAWLVPMAPLLITLTGWIWSSEISRLTAAGPLDGQPLDVRAFGAQGDGVTDDTDAVRAGIDAASKSGRTLLLPKGTYLIKEPLRVTTHGLKIMGAGAQHTVLKAAAEMNRLLYLRGTGMVISRLTLDGNNKANYGIHAFHLNEQDSRLEFLRVQGARSHGFFLDHSQVFEISNCIAQGNRGDGFYITDCNGTRISCCRSMENRGRGFCVTRTDLSGGCWLLDCDAELNACEGLVVSDMAGTPVVIERMWVETNNKPKSLGPHKYDAIRIASRSVMLTRSRISTRGDAPLRPKYAIHLASETRIDIQSDGVQFQLGEMVKGSDSGATGVVSLTQADPLFGGTFPIPVPYRDWLSRPKKLMLREVSGTFKSGETVTGQASQAVAVIRAVSQVSAENCVISDNWVAREEGRTPVDRVKLDPGCRSNHIGRNHRMWAAGVVDVDYSDDPGSVVGGRSLTAGNGPPATGRWPRGAFRFNQSPTFAETTIMGKEIIQNGNMEQDTHWKRYGTPRSHKKSQEQTHGGEHALKVIGSGGAGVRQYLPETTPGQRYQLSGWLYIATGTARLIVHDGKNLHYGTTSTDSQWTRMTMSFSTVAGSTPYIGAQTVGDDAEFYLDDVVCQPIEGTKAASRLVLGWVCTTGGTPGIWVPVYVLSESSK